MKNIAIVSPGYLWFPCESGFGRMFDIACGFSQAGYRVDAYVTDFQHHQKSARDTELILSQGYPMDIYFAHAPAYSKNISLKRIKSNKIAAENILKLLSARIDEYDAVFVSIPPNNIAADVAGLCKSHNIPCVLDIEDLWPEAMYLVIKNKILQRLLLYGFKRDAEKAYSLCDAVIGTSSDYTARAFKGNKRDIPAVTAHVGCDIDAFDSFVSENLKEVEKSQNEFWVTYAGSISTSYDIETLIKASGMLFSKNKNIRIHILGTGTKYEELKTYVEKNNIDTVTFHGFVKYPIMAAFLAKSDVLINSFKKNAPQSIVNKVGDYLAAGKPILNTLETPVFREMLDRYKAGINVPSEDAKALEEAVLSLYEDPTKVEEMGKNARTLCLSQFDRKKSIKDITGLFESLIKGEKR